MKNRTSFLQVPFQLGAIQLPNNIFYAPLAGCSDYPFRQMSANYHPGLIYCEMVKMDALVRFDQGTFHILDYARRMHPIGGQICGSKPEIAGQAAKIIEDLGFDVVDLNCGCPVDKVTKDGSGSGMMKNPALIGEVLEKMVAAVKIPVTVKIRAGWDENLINAPLITQIAEQAGAKAICIHGRTRQQGYRGAANWDWIKACKEVAKSIKIIGNGDLFDALAAEKMFEHTGCDAILVSRGTLGQPWIVEDIIRKLQGEEPRSRTLEDCRQALLEHFNYTINYQQTRRAVVDMRRVGCWYLKKSAGTRAFREQISRAESIEQVQDLILNFPLGEMNENEINDQSEGEISC
ncbi:tRNA dihydrouridine synthase DusB [Neochlamydia sp. S13]|uniref:tRNA dihydrouridine synthase DusB n=1 Tax=Neochlamydia sp. S13 TaxID=1353976 RepID=UPI0005A8EC7D|nr:tRNA dihydrouridine synthase DusB [Neochlamydia sp. S13]BBI18031.1 tRNA-dihydrouridine synthase [Neochlamydia sp. S13]